MSFPVRWAIIIATAAPLALLGLPVAANAATSTTVNLTLTPGDTTIKADWSLNVGTDGANGAILSRNGTASDTGSTVGWSSAPISGTTGSLTFIHLYDCTTYSITVQPTANGVKVGTPITEQATPVAAGQTCSTGSGARGPQPVNVSVQGSAHNATASNLSSVLASTPVGDTVVLAGGNYGNVTLSASKGTSGTVRLVPAAGATVTFGTVTFSGSGLDVRGVNTTGQVTVTGQNDFWRGGTHSRTSSQDGFLIRDGAANVTVEDATVTNALVSFYLQGTASLHPNHVTLARFKSTNVSQDHIFGSWGDYVTIRDGITQDHVNNADHNDGIQIVGLKDVTIYNDLITNSLALRDASGDRNDHGIMVNYDQTDGSGRVPERITVDSTTISNQRSYGICVAGVLTMTVKNSSVVDNGLSGNGLDVNVYPDPHNQITGWSESNDTIGAQSVTTTG